MTHFQVGNRYSFVELGIKRNQNLNVVLEILRPVGFATGEHCLKIKEVYVTSFT